MKDEDAPNCEDPYFSSVPAPALVKAGWTNERQLLEDTKSRSNAHEGVTIPPEVRVEDYDRNAIRIFNL